MADPLPELKTLGRYTIERTIGSGAMGVVYEGIDPTLGRKVAIKTILKTQLDEDTAKEYSKRFLREAKAVARLNHPNIVQVYDFGEAGEVAYLVMEFIKGKELKSFFEANERFELKEIVRIMGELCEALEFAHNAGIIHRDIKPANVMLDAHAHTKLTDFGVARVQDADKTMERTQAGTLVGTPAYMSPEQITGVNIDKRSDVFSAGIILYQFLTGEKPFTGSGAWTIAKKILHEEPPLPSSLNNAVTPLFDAVVNKALAKNPEQRFQSARELGAALKSALEGKTVAMPMGGAMPIARVPARAVDSDTTVSNIEEAELEFWRAIKEGNDAHDFELYVQQFPNGIYAALAKRKIAKLRGEATEDAKAAEEEKKELQEAARREADAKAKLEAEKARLEAEIRRKEEEYRRREAEAVAKAEAEAKARAAEEAEARNARRRALRTVAIVGVIVVAAVSSVIYIQLQEVARERDAAIARAKQADEARRHAEELSAKADDAMKQANDAFERFQQAVLAENRARAAGDAERMKQLAEARRKAEEDAVQRRQVAEALVRQANDAKRNAPPVVATAPVVAPTITAPTKPPAQEAAKSPAVESTVAAQTPKPAPVEPGNAPPPEKADVDPFKLAQSLEAKNGKEAVRAYSALAKSGHCEAARRLGQIYEKGVRDVPRDYQESLQWYRRAEQLGCKVTRATGRV